MTRDEFTDAARKLMATPVEGVSPSDKAELVRQVLAAVPEGPPATPSTDPEPALWTDSSWYDIVSKGAMFGCFLLALAVLADKAWWVQWSAGAAAAVLVSVILFNVVRAVQPLTSRRNSLPTKR